MLPQKYKNKLFNKDVLEVLESLPDDCLDMVYGDPDYNVGVSYAGKKYTKKWDDYIAWYGKLAKQSMRTLKPTGNLFLMNYPKQNAYLRVKHLDHIAYDVQDYVWTYNTNIGHSKKRFTTAHRSILHARKTKHNHFYKNQVLEPYKNPNDTRIKQRMKEGHRGRMPYSWLYYNLVKNISKDKTFHACQIPLPLVELLIKAATKKGDDVFVLFGGSGSELFSTKKLGRNFLSCEINKTYYKMIKERLKSNGKLMQKHRLPFTQKTPHHHKQKTQQFDFNTP